ncbi:hypothetical protein PIROE2DRAFT_5451 [Piromyces sp. E2]|nr:hypothetical protein PIROE2DRAFT_5451 [Piromyces sp. E2]|eukprot:OUM67183.1 hypothetical protein PIROE2DRAFT_5451 [Piromyces sp. E2]
MYCNVIIYINYFSVLANELESHEYNLSADEMVDKFLETSNDIGKEIKAIIPSNLKGLFFHCPQYIKNLSHEKHIAYKNIKPLADCSVPLGLKKIILQLFDISKINYYAPLLGFNKKRTSRVQSLINTGILWCINSFSGKGNSSNKKNKAFHEHNSYISLYALSRDLIISSLAGIYLVRDIPTMSHYSWTKESKSLYKKLKKNNIKKINEINEHYWIISPLNNGIKPLRYSNLQFKNSTSITLTPDFPNYCPCCGHGEQTFLHWILLCPALTQYRTTSLAFNELQIDKTEQRHLNEQLYSSSRVYRVRC